MSQHSPLPRNPKHQEIPGHVPKPNMSGSALVMPEAFDRTRGRMRWHQPGSAVLWDAICNGRYNWSATHQASHCEGASDAGQTLWMCNNEGKTPVDKLRNPVVSADGTAEPQAPRQAQISFVHTSPMAQASLRSVPQTGRQQVGAAGICSLGRFDSKSKET